MDKQELEFCNILVAAMKDAANSKKLTQIKTVMANESGNLRCVRLIIVPEEMEYVKQPDGGYKK